MSDTVGDAPPPGRSALAAVRDCGCDSVRIFEKLAEAMHTMRVGGTAKVALDGFKICANCKRTMKTIFDNVGAMLLRAK